ncbi:MAG TPA: hypothetical protein VEA69_23390 [Tepidisphaeraceae bacterium]|nr:hypothetical protein [Tepidisphaeraceae bacterium]
MQLPPLLRFLFARTFKPFDIYLSDQRRFRITHPETAIVHQGGLGLWVMLPTGQLEFIDGDAVTSFQSSGVVDPAEFFEV